MSEDDFWVGVGAGALGLGLLLYGGWKLHEASYQRGWNGEQLIWQNLFGILGWTESGALVLIQSFNMGKYDRELSLQLNTLTNTLKSIEGQTRYAIDRLQELEHQVKERPRTEISIDESNFLKELYEIAQAKLTQPQSSSRRSKTYVA